MNTIPGMDHYLKVPKKHALFLPESLVDVIPSASTKASQDVEAHGIAEALNVNTEELLEEQRIAATLVAEESLDITKQQEQYQKLQVDAAVKELSNFQGNHGQHENVNVTRQQEEFRYYEAQKKAEETNNEVSDTGRKQAEHLYDNPDEFHPCDSGVVRTGTPSQHRRMKQEPHQPQGGLEQPLPVHAKETSQVPAPSQWQDKVCNRSYSNQPEYSDPPHNGMSRY